MSVGYLPNAFDMLNVRDLALITQARQHCSQLVIGVFSDDFAERLLGRRPVVPMADRVAMVSHVRGVDAVVVHDGVSPAPERDVAFSVHGDVPFLGRGPTRMLRSRRELPEDAGGAALEVTQAETV